MIDFAHIEVLYMHDGSGFSRMHLSLIDYYQHNRLIAYGSPWDLPLIKLRKYMLDGL